MTVHPSPPLVDATVALAVPPTPMPVGQVAEVEVDGDEAMVFIDAPGCIPLPATVTPLVNDETQLEPPPPP